MMEEPPPQQSEEELLEEATPTDIEKEKKYKYGIIYLSYIPDGLTVKVLREYMSQFGEVGRIYLEPEASNATSKRKKYSEGWVEFKKKRTAKKVAEELNGTELNYGRKHSILTGQIWSIRYLHKFKWIHLTHQLEVDRESKKQQRRIEMAESKEQANFYQKMMLRSKMMKKKKFHEGTGETSSNEKIGTLKSRQKRPVAQGSEMQVNVDEDFLSSIFKKVD